MTRGGVRTTGAAESAAGSRGGADVVSGTEDASATSGVSVAEDATAAGGVGIADDLSGHAGSGRAHSELNPAELREALTAWVCRAKPPGSPSSATTHNSAPTPSSTATPTSRSISSAGCRRTTPASTTTTTAPAITVLEGAITEERLAINGTVETNLETGDTVSIAREAIHRVRHRGQKPAVTLHAYYSPPLQRVGTYEIATNGALLRHPRPAETPLHAVA